MPESRQEVNRKATTVFVIATVVVIVALLAVFVF